MCIRHARSSEDLFFSSSVPPLSSAKHKTRSKLREPTIFPPSHWFPTVFLWPRLSHHVAFRVALLSFYPPPFFVYFSSFGFLVSRCGVLTHLLSCSPISPSLYQGKAHPTRFQPPFLFDFFLHKRTSPLSPPVIEPFLSPSPSLFGKTVFGFSLC